MGQLAVRDLKNGNIMYFPNDNNPNFDWKKIIIILMITFLVIKILINNI